MLTFSIIREWLSPKMSCLISAGALGIRSDDKSALGLSKDSNSEMSSCDISFDFALTGIVVVGLTISAESLSSESDSDEAIETSGT